MAPQSCAGLLPHRSLFSGVDGLDAFGREAFVGGELLLIGKDSAGGGVEFRRGYEQFVGQNNGLGEGHFAGLGLSPAVKEAQDTLDAARAGTGAGKLSGLELGPERVVKINLR